MIVTCPSCAVRYVVDPRAFGAKGRTVRCARCGHTWHHDAPPETLQEPAPPPPQAPEAPAAPSSAAAAPASPRERAAPVVAAREDRVQLPALSRPPRRWATALIWAASLLLLLVGLVAAAIVERGRVVSMLPAAARFYALAGFPVTDVGLGLVFRNVTTSRDMDNGLPTLVIEGEVTNVSSVARAVPKLVAILRDRGEHELQEQNFAVDAASLLPGQSVQFHTTISQPAEEASGVIVTFARAGGG